MTLEERNYQRVARYLDGEAIELDAAERALADEIRRDESSLYTRLDVPLPDGLEQRQARRVLSVSRPRRRLLRFSAWGGALAAAAAMLLVAVLHTQPTSKPKTLTPQSQITTEQYVESLAPQAEVDTELELLSDMLDEVEADLAFVSDNALEVDGSIEELETSIETFWTQDDAWDEDWTIQEDS